MQVPAGPALRRLRFARRFARDTPAWRVLLWLRSGYNLRAAQAHRPSDNREARSAAEGLRDGPERGGADRNHHLDVVVGGPGAGPGTAVSQSGEVSIGETRPVIAFQQFHAGTGYDQVIAAMGVPERESTSENGAELVLFYRRHDLYVVLEKTRSTYSYVCTVRISDEMVLHERIAPR